MPLLPNTCCGTALWDVPLKEVSAAAGVHAVPVHGARGAAAACVKGTATTPTSPVLSDPATVNAPPRAVWASAAATPPRGRRRRRGW